MIARQWLSSLSMFENGRSIVLQLLPNPQIEDSPGNFACLLARMLDQERQRRDCFPSCGIFQGGDEKPLWQGEVTRRESVDRDEGFG